MITIEMISRAINVDVRKVTYIAYGINEENKYTTFEIPKKNGSKRIINKPIPILDWLQKKLKRYLEQFYKRKNCSFGFEYGLSIKNNAEQHTKKRLILNIDISNFFNSINFGRVYGLLLKHPFNFDKKASACIAKILTHKNCLPQGASTSPLISNMISRRLDSKLMKLAEDTKSHYTRFVDDITFSTNLEKFNKKILIHGHLQNVELGWELATIISDEGFRINNNKSRLLNDYTRKEVTGITVNKFPNVRRNYINSIFGMIHAWNKYGLKSSNNRYLARINVAGDSKDNQNDLFRAVVIGKINHVANIRGWDDIVVQKLCRKYCECDEKAPTKIRTIGEEEVKYNVFICHASEQKESIAIPIHKSLTALGIKAFIDIYNIKWGGSITQIINKALSEAEIFLPIISIDSIDKDWPSAEINSAIARNIEGVVKVLPLFTGSEDQINSCRKQFPLIHDTLFKTWDNNSDELALAIKEQLD